MKSAEKWFTIRSTYSLSVRVLPFSTLLLVKGFSELSTLRKAFGTAPHCIEPDE